MRHYTFFPASNLRILIGSNEVTYFRKINKKTTKKQPRKHTWVSLNSNQRCVAWVDVDDDDDDDDVAFALVVDVVAFDAVENDDDDVDDDGCDCNRYRVDN